MTEPAIPPVTKPSIAEQLAGVRQRLCDEIEFYRLAIENPATEADDAETWRRLRTGWEAKLRYFDAWVEERFSDPVSEARLADWVDESGQPLGYHRGLRDKFLVGVAGFFMWHYLRKEMTLDQVKPFVLLGARAVKSELSDEETLQLLADVADEDLPATDRTSRTERALSFVYGGRDVRQPIKDARAFIRDGRVGPRKRG